MSTPESIDWSQPCPAAIRCPSRALCPPACRQAGTREGRLDATAAEDPSEESS